MLFTLVPEEFCRVPAMYRRPCHYFRHPGPQSENLRRFQDVLMPMLLASRGRNVEGSDCCSRRQNGGCEQKQCMKTEGCLRKMDESTKAVVEQKKTEQKIASFDFRGFAPGEIKVKVTDKAVIIRGERGDSYSSLQVTKTVPLPQGADKTGVVCRYVDGHVTVQLPPSHKSGEESAKRQTGEKAKESDRKEGDPIKKDTRDSEREDTTDMDREMQAEFQNSMKTLTGLFSSIFGIPLDEGCEERDEKERKTDSQDAEKSENMYTSDSGKTNDTASKDACRENGDAKDDTQCAGGDDEETCLMLKYEEKLPLKEGDDDFVKVEKEEVDTSLLSEQTTVTDLEEGDETEPETDGRADDGEEQLLVDADTPTDHSVKENDEMSAHIVEQKEDFQVQFDLASYNPEKVRVFFRDGDVIVEAERDMEADNHSFVEKLTRSIRVPENVDESKLKSVLDARGMMTIRAPYISGDEETWKVISVVHED